MSDPAANDVIPALIEALGEGAVFREEADRRAYEDGWRYGHGRARAVIKPRHRDEVALACRIAAAAGQRIQPIGANTGLVGASNPDPSGEQIVLSFERLSTGIELDLANRSVLVDAGVTLNQLNAALEDHGLFFPVDLGADPQIGGMIATNTGGTRLIRYGAVRAHVLGLEVVLPDGTIWSDLSGLRKDNRGLDWKQLFIGTSGSFGVVTRARLSLAALPRQTVTAWAALADGATTIALLGHLERDLGEFLSAYEVLSRDAYRLTLEFGANIQRPFGAEELTYAALIELSSSLPKARLDLEAAMVESLEAFFSENTETVLDVVPHPPREAWHIRHQVSESLRHEGRVLALDISVPRSRIAEFTDRVREWLAQEAPEVLVADFGHWGDGGTHLNLVWKPDSVADEAAFKERIQTRVYDLAVREFEGSFSAEHGVGPHNQRHYDRLTDPKQLELCRVLKQHFDPENRFGTVRFEGSSPEA
ncbi:MAG: FAD-binding oxidoreductase [Planctomycetota bacterium]